MTNQHNPPQADTSAAEYAEHGRCVVCQQRPAWAPRHVCVLCYKGLRANLAELADVDEWLGECMTSLPSTWREHTIHSHPTEAPAPMPLHLADARATVSDTAWYWVVMVHEAKHPKPRPPVDESVRAATRWLARHLGWIVRQPAVADFAAEVRTRIARAELIAPRPQPAEDLLLPCPSCGTVGLTQYGGAAGLIVCYLCRIMLTPAAYREAIETAASPKEAIGT